MLAVRNIFTYLLLGMCLIGCGKKSVHQVKEPLKKDQWINPLYYNNDFEHELNFPLWFNDSLIKAHRIYKITKRVFGHPEEDSTMLSQPNHAIPKEKTEFYFDPNGLVDQLVIYAYHDDREISRANFIYEGNMAASGYRAVRALPFLSLNKKNTTDEFSTEIIQDPTQQYTFLIPSGIKAKYRVFADPEKGSLLFLLPNKKYWGPLSVDSIIKPKSSDWIVHGTMRKPYKRYKVENIVNESLIYRYVYYKSGVLKQRIHKAYPFERRRYYQYNKEHQWCGYIDSTFSELQFISRTIHEIHFDVYGRPMEIIHRKMNGEQEGYTYRETINYRAKQ